MDDELRSALRRLREEADHVVRVSGRTPVRSWLYDVTRGRIDRRPRPTVGQLPWVDAPWQDTVSGRYHGWRCRRASLKGGLAFVVEYVVCPYCNIGWVDKPYTVEDYQRCGLAAAGLAALRAEHPGVAWYTGSGHLRDSRPFWSAVGQGVDGAYQPREMCEHVEHHGGVRPRWKLRQRPQRR